MGLGIGDFLGGLGKLMDKLPIQGRKERWKNELDNLTQERKTLLKNKATLKMAERIGIIDTRIAYLNQLLKNSATD